MEIPDETRTIITLARGDVSLSSFKAAVFELCKVIESEGVTVIDTDMSKADGPGAAHVHVYLGDASHLRQDYLYHAQSLGLAIVHFRRILRVRGFE